MVQSSLQTLLEGLQLIGWQASPILSLYRRKILRENRHTPFEKQWRKAEYKSEF